MKREGRLTSATVLSVTALLISIPRDPKINTSVSLLSTVETHLASQHDLLKQNHVSLLLIHFPPIYISVAMGGEFSSKTDSQIQSVGFSIMSEGYTEWETFRQIDEKTGNTDKVLFPSS